MILKLILVGKTNKSFLVEGEKEYTKRISRYVKFQEEVISDVKKSLSYSEDEIKKREGIEILNKINNSDYVILLDENGKSFSSIEFSKKIEHFALNSIKSIVFVIGGAYGFSEDVYKRSNESISLSKLTFSHQMVRVFFKEQLYRAFTILKGEPYHHK